MISLCQQRELTAKWEAEHQCPAMACGVPPVRVNEHIRSLWPCKTVNAGSTCCQHTQHWRTDVCSFKSHCSTSCLFLGCLEQQTAAGTRSRLTWWDTEIKQGVWFPDVGEEHMVPPPPGAWSWEADLEWWGWSWAIPYHQITSTRGGEWSIISSRNHNDNP